MKEVKVANVKISELPAFSGSIDPTNDELPIVNDSDDETQRINRNTFLNLTSQPVGLTDSQSPTNKTFDNTNTITLKDTLFTLQDDGDTTKQLRFQLSGITTATTRTLTIPNASTTIVGTDATQTLTNKTLTSPVINTATISNPTIATDSVSEYTAAHGVTVDGLNIKDGALNTSNSVVTASITDAAVTPAKLVSGTGTGWSWSSWTPTFVNMSGGSINYSKYIQIGKTVYYRWQYTLAGTGISGSVTFTLPVAASSDYTTGINIGSASYIDTGTQLYVGYATPSSTTVGLLRAFDASSTVLTGTTALSSTVPFSWNNTDSIIVQGFYEAA